MEQVYPLQCLSQYIQLGKDLDSVNEKLYKQQEVFLQIYYASLNGQIAVPAAEAALRNSKNDLVLATQRFHQANQQYQSSLALLKTLTSTNHFLEIALNNIRELMKSQQEKVDDLNNERRHLADSIRFVNIEVQSIEDVDMVLSLREEINWSGSIHLVDGLESAKKDVLTCYICSTALVGVFVSDQKLEK